MDLKLKFLLISLLAICYSHAQENTVFITSTEEKKTQKQRGGLFDEAGLFSNFTASAPFRFNPDRGDTDPDTGETNENWFIPDGLNLHAGMGVHATESVALSLHTGIDGILTSKLVVAPVYASILLNPAISDGTTLYFQAGVGRAFALGRGDLSGIYQKYRIGFTDEGYETGFFVEANFYGFGVYDIPTVATLNIGISLFKFD